MLVFFLTFYLALAQYDRSINLLHIAGVHNQSFAWIIRTERRTRTHLRLLLSFFLTLFFRMRKGRKIKQGGRGTLKSKSQKKKRRRKGAIFMGTYFVVWIQHLNVGKRYVCVHPRHCLKH